VLAKQILRAKKQQPQKSIESPFRLGSSDGKGSVNLRIPIILVEICHVCEGYACTSQSFMESLAMVFKDWAVKVAR